MILRPPYSYADANALRVIRYLQSMVPSSMTPAKAAAIDTFFRMLVLGGLWSKVVDFGLFTFGNATVHSLKWKTFGFMTAVNTMTHNATNITLGSSNTGYWKTGIIPSTCGISTSSLSFAFYKTGNTTGDNKYLIGTYDGGSNLSRLNEYGSGLLNLCPSSSSDSISSTTSTPQSGLFIANRTGTSNTIQKKTTASLSEIASGTSSTVGTLLAYEYYMFAFNQSNGTPGGYLTSDVVSFWHVGLGMTSDERTNFATLVYNLLTSLGVSVV